MENKVLVSVLFPQLEKDFDVFIPVNELVWKIKKLILKSIMDLCDADINAKNSDLINLGTGKIYGNNDIIINTDIRNGAELMLIYES